MKRNPFRDLLQQNTDAEVVEFPRGGKRVPRRNRRFALVPLDQDWGYRAMKVGGYGGAAIILHALYVQRTTGRGEVPITADLLRRCGVSRETRGRLIQRLVRAGMATVRYRGRGQGCPLLTLCLPPAADS